MVGYREKHKCKQNFIFEGDKDMWWGFSSHILNAG
jgi:hypothetical protein